MAFNVSTVFRVASMMREISRIALSHMLFVALLQGNP